MTERYVTGVVVEEVTIEEATRFCRVRREKIAMLVEEGIIEPEGAREAEWRFSGAQMRRAVKALRLESDLDINLSAVAIILDLLDEIDTLKARFGEH